MSTPGKIASHSDSVALYFHRLGTRGGGAQRVLCLLAEGLAMRGYNVHVVSWDDASATSFYPLCSEVSWHRLGFSPGPYGKLLRIKSLFDVLTKHDIRELVGFVVSGDRTVFAASRLAGANVIAAERNAPTMYYYRCGRLNRWLSFATLHLASRIVVQCADFIQGYPERLRKKIDVIPNPVTRPTHRACPQHPGPKGRCTLLAVGRLDQVQKCLDTLIMAFAMVADRHPNWDLRVIGNGPEESKLRELVVQKKLGERVSMEGSIQNISPAYRDAHLFVLPSRWEGFPNALAEALAHGLPAIGFRNASGVAQLITEGETGWLADGLADEMTLAKALDDAMTASGSERLRRGANAANSIAAYTPEEHIERWEGLIQSVSGETHE